VDLVWLISKSARSQCIVIRHEGESAAIFRPTNGFGWMGALARATAAKDDAARLVALAAIGRSQRFDIYWTSLNARLALAAIRTKKLSFVEAQQSVVAVWFHASCPLTGALCGLQSDRLSDAAVLAACRGVANSLAHGDTYLTEMIGVQIAHNAWPENHRSGRRRTGAQGLRILIEPLGEVTGALPSLDGRTLSAALCQYPREQDVWRAQLIDAGERPDPPVE